MAEAHGLQVLLDAWPVATVRSITQIDEILYDLGQP